MHPVIFQWGPITIYSYGVMLAISLLVCSWLFSKDAQKANLDAQAAYDLVFWCTLWGVLGARVYYVILFWSTFAQDPLEIIMLQHGGLAWQGGLIAGGLAGAWFVRKHKWPLAKVIDLSAPYLALGQAIGRVGCFMTGCCFGAPVAWGIDFPSHHARLHPTQLYECLSLVVIFVILRWYRTQKHAAGSIFVAYLVLASIERFIIEFWRADHDMFLNLSIPQWMALGILSVGIVLGFKLKAKQ